VPADIRYAFYKKLKLLGGKVMGVIIVIAVVVAYIVALITESVAAGVIVGIVAIAGALVLGSRMDPYRITKSKGSSKKWGPCTSCYNNGNSSCTYYGHAKTVSGCGRYDGPDS